MNYGFCVCMICMKVPYICYIYCIKGAPYLLHVLYSIKVPYICYMYCIKVSCICDMYFIKVSCICYMYCIKVPYICYMYCIKVSCICHMYCINPNRYCWGPFGPTATLKANISMMAEGKKKFEIVYS